MELQFANTLLTLQAKTHLGISTPEENTQLNNYKSGATQEVLVSLNWYKKELEKLRIMYLNDLEKR